jgi:dTMP kinase
VSVARGKFVTLEGIDGAGTTTQLIALRDWLTQTTGVCQATFEPSVGPIGSYIRTILRGEGDAPPPDSLALLFAADRLDHIAREVEPALSIGEHVLSDRYVGSSLAYQGSESGFDWVETLNERALAPDLTLYLRISASAALERITVRDGARRELFEHQDILERISAGYDEIYLNRTEAHGCPVVTVDATASIDAVFEECKRHVNALFVTD